MKVVYEFRRIRTPATGITGCISSR